MYTVDNIIEDNIYNLTKPYCKTGFTPGGIR